MWNRQSISHHVYRFDSTRWNFPELQLRRELYRRRQSREIKGNHDRRKGIIPYASCEKEGIDQEHEERVWESGRTHPVLRTDKDGLSNRGEELYKGVNIFLLVIRTSV